MRDHEPPLNPINSIEEMRGLNVKRVGSRKGLLRRAEYDVTGPKTWKSEPNAPILWTEESTGTVRGTYFNEFHARWRVTRGINSLWDSYVDAHSRRVTPRRRQ